MKNILSSKLVLLVTVLLVSLAVLSASPKDAYAAKAYDLKDQNSCQSMYYGSSWNSTTHTCTVTNISLTLNSGDSLTVESDVTLVINSGSITNSGSIKNSGTIITNSGTINNSGGTINNYGNIVNNSGTIYNYSTITNSGTIITNSGTINNNFGTIITNYGTIITNSGTVYNFEGTIINSGAIINNSIITNSGTIYNYGTITNTCKGTIPDNLFGIVVNSCTSTTTTLVTSSNTSTVGETVTLTATVSPTPDTGDTVTFLDDTDTIGTGTTDGAGTATLTTSSLSVGDHSITASFAGDANNAASTSDAITLTINPIHLHAKKDDILSSLQALDPQDNNDSHDLGDAIKKLVNSTDPKLWQYDDELNPKGGEKVFDFEKESVHKLMDIIKHGKESAAFDGAIQDAIDGMVSVDKTIASQAIDKASSVTGHDAVQEVGEAQKEMQMAADELSKGHYDHAIDHYKNAWKKVEEVLQKNS